MISSKLRSLHRKQQALISQLGFSNACLLVAIRITAKLSIPASFTKYYFVSQPLNAVPLMPKKKGSKLRIVELPPNALENHPCPRPYAVLAERYQQHATCLAAFKGDEFTGCLWYTKNHYQEDEVRCMYQLVSAKSVWDFDVFIETKHRTSLVFLKLWDAASNKLNAEGFDWSLSRISAFNSISLSSHKRLGATVFGWALFVRLGFIQFTFSSLQPYFHILL